MIWANLTGHVKAQLLREGHSEYIATPKPGMQYNLCLYSTGYIILGIKFIFFFSFSKVCTVRVDQKTGNLYWVSCDELSLGATHISLPDQSVSNQLYQASGAINDLFVDWQRGQLYWLEDGQIINMKLGLLGGNAKAIFSSEDNSVSHVVLDLKAQRFLWRSQNGL